MTKSCIIKSVLVVLTLAFANGFVPTRLPRSFSPISIEAVTEASNDFASAMPDEVDPHVTIGVEPDKLAIGINATEFLEWVGTRKELIEKMQSDFKSYSPEKVETEVDKFMMDAENVNMYIRYLKDKKENPAKYAQEALEAELSLSNPKTLATYAAWLVGGVSFGVIRREFIDPKFESGEWKAISIELPFMSKPDAAVEAASTLTSKANVIADGMAYAHDSLNNFVEHV